MRRISGSDASSSRSVVLGDPSVFTDGTERARPAPTTHRFRVELSRVDEYTLSRWVMPPVGSNASTIKELSDELERIFNERDQLLEKDLTNEEARTAAATLLPHEPAVAAVGIRVTIVDSTGRETTKTITQPVVRQTPFLANAFTFTVSLTGNASGPMDWTVPAGSFASIELRPLVTEADYARFETGAMKELVDLDVWVDTASQAKYRAFAASRVLVESARDLLPAEEDLFKAFTLGLDTVGAVRALLDEVGIEDKSRRAAFHEAMAFVDRFSLDRERWVWRNLPLLDPDAMPPAPNAPEEELSDWRRRATGGLPRALWDPTKRDDADDVHRFDVLAEIDNGLVKRGLLRGVMPKGAGEPLARALLATDDRDAVASADYLRFGLTVRSRYAGMFRSVTNSERTARRKAASDLEVSPTWRRIVAPFRGGALKPLRILVVLPLTRMPATNPFGAQVSNSATGFLVVLDESWFREYGQGESLEAYLALEPHEIGDDSPNPFRAAPLPDHYVLPANTKGETPYYRNSLAMEDDETKEQQIFPRHPLNVFGPFGYTLDRADGESLANATAFVVYPPADVGPHWWMGARVRRVLRSFDETLKPITRRGEPSDIQHLYTLPGNLATLKEPATLTLREDRSVALHNLELHLEPTPQPSAAVAGQYAYVLIFGRRVTDGGRGVDVMLPTWACWLTAGGTKWEPLTSAGEIPRGIALRGRVIEILLNGRPATNPFRSKDVDSLKALLKKLLPVNQDPPVNLSREDQDALGALRRPSDEFTVIVS